MKKLINLLAMMSLVSCTKEFTVASYPGSTIDTASMTRPDTVIAKKHNDLPILYINSPEITSKEVYVDGTLTIDGNGRNDTLTFASQFRGRGNSTWSYPWTKLPYKIKFIDKQTPFGWPADKEWALLANYFDDTHGLRNDVYFHVSEVLQREWTPKRQFVDLFLRGAYNGTYLFTETVKSGKDRVNIDAKKGGWLIEVSHSGADDYFDWGVRNPLDDPQNRGNDGHVPSDFKEGASKAAAKEQLDTLWAVAYRRDSQKLNEILDMQSFVTFFLLNEVTKNNDAAFWSSVYLQKNNTTGKIRMGPAWDADLSAGNKVIPDDIQPEGWRLTDAQFSNSVCEDPVFRSMVKQVWQKHLSEIMAVPGYIGQKANYIRNSAAANNVRFEINESFSEKSLVDWYTKRIEWIDTEVYKF